MGGLRTFARLPQPQRPAGLLAVQHRLDDLAGLAAAVDVGALGSSKGGSGLAVAPRLSASAGR